MTNKNKSNKPIVAQKQKLQEWREKVQNGEALEMVKKLCLSTQHNFDTDQKIKKIMKDDVVPKIFGYKEGEISDEELLKLDPVFTDFGLENHLSIICSTEEKYRGLAVNLRKSLIKEYSCQTASEKTLVDLIVGAYTRNLSISGRFINIVLKSSTTQLINDYLKLLSKEIDRVNRQYISALETLRAIKQPSLSVSVKAENAFIGQNNQQINNQNKDEYDKKKIIDSN